MTNLSSLVYIVKNRLLQKLLVAASAFSEINPVLLYFFPIKIIPMEMPPESES